MREDKNLTEGGFSIDMSVSRDRKMLDLIYPDYMSYEGYVSLEDVCNTWIITLLALGKA